MPSLNLGHGFNTVCYTGDLKPLSTLIKHENKMVVVTLIRCICEERHNFFFLKQVLNYLNLLIF